MHIITQNSKNITHKSACLVKKHHSSLQWTRLDPQIASFAYGFVSCPSNSQSLALDVHSTASIAFMTQTSLLFTILALKQSPLRISNLCYKQSLKTSFESDAFKLVYQGEPETERLANFRGGEPPISKMRNLGRLSSKKLLPHFCNQKCEEGKL